MRKISPRREFYSHIDEIRNLYENKGFLFATDLYEEMKKVHNLKMSYWTFNEYFKKEIKKKEIKDETGPQKKLDSEPILNKEDNTTIQKETNDDYKAEIEAEVMAYGKKMREIKEIIEKEGKEK
ncbi:MAG: hypothetical protein PHO65_07005 [Sulfurovum sp.]|nr:hypothetical protein [Sulfurovum sp.]